MAKRTRTILFTICVVLFLITAPSMVLYSQGYRFDFDSKKITQTGGLFLKIAPKQAGIYLDEKLEEKTDFFFGSVLIENLLPKKYKIEVKKTGYFTWEKTLEVREKEVTEAKNVVLFPENPNFNILSGGIEKFWFSPDQRKIVWMEVLDKTGWSLKLYDLDRNVKSQLINGNNIYKNGADLISLKFSEISKEISLEVGVAEEIKHFSLLIDRTPPFLTEIQESAATTSENILVSEKINNDLYYLSNSGHLFKNQEKLTQIPFPIKQETEYTLEVFPDFIFLREGEILYQLNLNSKSFEKFFEGIKDLKISPDYRKLLLFSNYEIWVLFLKDDPGQPKRTAGEKILLMRLSENIQDCLWLNSDYLIFNTGDKIKIIETDDRDRIQIWEIGNFPNPKLFFNETDKKLYLLSEGDLYNSVELFK